MKASEFAILIPECCAEVLDAMYFTTVLSSTLLEKVPQAMPDTDADMAFGLSFTGDISGNFGIQMQPATARALAANFLGEDDPNTSSTAVSEVVGELANMLCGSVMSRVEGERKFALSHPEVVILAPSDVDDILVSMLETDSGAITVWVSVEGSQCPS
jgi:CheY-specific phosphatase CheX